MCDFRFQSISGSILIELMLSVAIGLLLMSGLIEIYLTSQRAIKLQKQLLEIQTNAQLVSDILHTEIKKSGNIGCAKLTDEFPIISHAGIHCK